MLLRRVTLALLVLAVAVYADRFDDIVRTEMERQHIPGLAIAVIQNGEPVRLEGYGIANLEHNVPVTPRTAFKLASVSKQFLAAAMLLLSDEGRVSLDHPVKKYIEDAPPSWDSVTIRHLLSHTGGLVRECPAFNAYKAIPDADLVRSAFSRPLAFAPGEKYQYSNAGYFAAAEIIRRLSGRNWEAFVRDRLFLPAGMVSSHPTSTTQLIPNRADGYDWTAAGYQNAADYIAVRPSGAFVSTLEDMVRWDAALDTDKPLNAALREQMWKPVSLNDRSSSGYSLGWNIAERKGRRVLHHGGSMPGFRTHYARFPDERVSLIVLSNSSSGQPGEILWKVAALWLPGFE
jgi:CubicO group peptidase (beta-lactamase class C family)